MAFCCVCIMIILVIFEMIAVRMKRFKQYFKTLSKFYLGFSTILYMLSMLSSIVNIINHIIGLQFKSILIEIIISVTYTIIWILCGVMTVELMERNIEEYKDQYENQEI